MVIQNGGVSQDELVQDHLARGACAEGQVGWDPTKPGIHHPAISKNLNFSYSP